MSRSSGLPGIDSLGITVASLLAQADLKHLRRAFEPFSMAMIDFVSEQGVGNIQLYIQNCPMALGDGADWLSAAPAIRNPYYGDMMLTCGVVKDSLTH